MLVYFLTRIKPEIIDKINRQIVKQTWEQEEAKNSETEPRELENKNPGQLMFDPSAVPSDIKSPTDLGWLNQPRQILNKLIDKLYQPLKGKLEKKPRTSEKKPEKKNNKKIKKKSN